MLNTVNKTGIKVHKDCKIIHPCTWEAKEELRKEWGGEYFENDTRIRIALLQ